MSPPKKKAKRSTPRKKQGSKKKAPARKAGSTPSASPRRGRWILVAGLLLLAWPLTRIGMAVAAELVVEDLSGFDAAIGGVSLREGGRELQLRDLRLRHPRRFGRFLEVDEVRVPFRTALWKDRGTSVGTVTLEGLCLRLFPGDLKSLDRGGDRDGGQSEPEDQGSDRPASPSSDEPARPLPPERIEIRDGRIELALPRNGRRPFVLTLHLPFLRAVTDGEGGWKLAEVEANLLGGRLRLEGRRRRDGRWSLDTRLADASVAAHPEARALGLSGQLNAALKLSTESEDDSPFGAGWIDLRRGLVWELPLVSDLIAALGLATGEGDLVRQGRARFHLEQGRLEVSELHLRGTPLSLWGRGGIALATGRVEVDLIPRVMEGATGDLPLIGDPTQLLLDLVGGAAVQVRLRGSLEDPRLETTPIPALGDPLRAVFDALGGR